MTDPGMNFHDRAPKISPRIRGRRAEGETPTFPVHTVDTLGAGDIFHGAFALASSEGQELNEVLRFASAAAALKCMRFGGAFAAPQRVEVEELLRQGRAASPAPMA
jgi:sugar/nucleoside kinase (ribokinase family)